MWKIIRIKSRVVDTEEASKNIIKLGNLNIKGVTKVIEKQKKKDYKWIHRWIFKWYRNKGYSRWIYRDGKWIKKRVRIKI